MPSLTIRNLDEETKRNLRVRAASNNRSMEEEARIILRTAVNSDIARGVDLASAIRKRFEPLGGIELELPKREPIRERPSADR